MSGNRAVAVELEHALKWDERLADVISQVGSPPVLVAGSMALTAGSVANPGAWLWAVTCVLIGVIPSVLYLVWLLHRGRIASLDIPFREHRIRPFVFTTGCRMVAWLVLWVGTAPLPLVLLAGILSLQTLFILLVTMRWKISVHCATASGAAVMAWSLVGVWLPMLVGVSLIAWSRVRLRRHTMTEAMAGLLLGFVVFQTALCVLRLA